MKRKIWYEKKYDHELILSRHRAPGPFSFVLVLDNLKPSFNVGKIFRTANAFGCREIHLVNIPIFDPTPAKGTVKQTKTRAFAHFSESYETLSGEGFEIFALAPSGDNHLGEQSFLSKTAFVLGHEEFGFSFKMSDYPNVKTMSIKQFGSVQSLNVSVAASLASYEYVRQRSFIPDGSP